MPDEPEVEKVHTSPPAARIVRPYALTAGRTRPVVDLPLEATLRLDTSATRRAWAEDVQGRIVAVCDSRSVAEGSALVKSPLRRGPLLPGPLAQQGHRRGPATPT